MGSPKSKGAQNPHRCNDFAKIPNSYQWLKHLVTTLVILNTSNGYDSVMTVMSQNPGTLDTSKVRWLMDGYSPSHLVSIGFDLYPNANRQTR